MASSLSPIDFDSWHVIDLQKFLKERGVSYSKSRKCDLVELCKLARENNLEVDPNCFKDSIDEQIKEKLRYAGRVIPHPDLLKGTADLSHIPSINNFDVYDYLKQSEAYPGNQLRDFKNLHGYKLYQSGYVEMVEVTYNVVGDGVHVVKFSVKPTQRKEDPINHVPFYKGWIILVPSPPFIQTAFCACKGGSDGVCRHTVATLLELVEFVEKYAENSVTSSACQWKKKVRQNTDVPMEVSKLSTSLPGTSRSQVPTADIYDPCPGIPLPNVDDFYHGIRALRPNANILYNRYKFGKPTEDIATCVVPSLLEKMKNHIEINPAVKLEDLMKSVMFSQDDRIKIERNTRGQSDNPQWLNNRKGMLTASKFYRVSHMKPSTNPDRFVTSLLLGDSSYGENIPAPLKWGQQNEVIARKLFMKEHKKNHQHVEFEDQGLVISDNHVFLGASPDGLVSCKQCGKFLLEIKCPFTKRNFYPKTAAREHCFMDDQKILHLDPKSQWYAQIQGQLGICKFDLCKLVVYTIKGVHVVDVHFDLTFWKELEEKLVKFYFSHVGRATLALLNE